MTCRRSFDIYYIHVLKDESQIRLAAGLIFVDAEAARVESHKPRPRHIKYPTLRGRRVLRPIISHFSIGYGGRLFARPWQVVSAAFDLTMPIPRPSPLAATLKAKLNQFKAPSSPLSLTRKRSLLSWVKPTRPEVQELGVREAPAHNNYDEAEQTDYTEADEMEKIMNQVIFNGGVDYEYVLTLRCYPVQ